MSNFEELTLQVIIIKNIFIQQNQKIVKSNEKFFRVVGIGRDITTIKENENKLKEQQEELESIFNTTKDGLAVINLETKFVKVNKAYCDITGLSEKELLQTSCLELTAPEYKEKHSINLKNFKKEGIVDSFEKVCLIKGVRITVNISASDAR